MSMGAQGKRAPQSRARRQLARLHLTGCAVFLLVLGSLAGSALAKTVRTIAEARSYVAWTAPAPTPLFFTADSVHRVLGHVNDVQFYRYRGEDFSGTVIYRPFDGGASTVRLVSPGCTSRSPR